MNPVKMVPLVILVVVAVSACGGGGVSFRELSIDARNAAASPAVAYASGADFVEALKRAGVPCAKQTITPQTVATESGTIYVADSVTCTYSEDDWVHGFVAWPSVLSSHYFSFYFESFQKAGAEVATRSLTLKGELWLATAPTDQRLFDTQEALGGQLIKPSDWTAGSPAATELSLATDTAAPTPGPSTTPAASVTASLPRAAVTTDALNVRTGPGTNYPKTGLLRKGDQVVVTGRTERGDWLAVTLADGKKGWVAASLVKLDVPMASLPVVQNIPKPPTPAATSKPVVPKATLTIDEQIAAVAKGTHGALPQPGDMGGVSAGGEAEVTIVNDTPNVLTVLVGSPSSTSITVEACSSCKHYSVGPSSCQEEGRPKRTIRLKPGSSQVVARVDDPSVTTFLGTWELKPDTAYFNCFYIVVR